MGWLAALPCPRGPPAYGYAAGTTVGQRAPKGPLGHMTDSEPHPAVPIEG